MVPVLEQPGVIRPDELYTLEEIRNRLGISNSTLRAARRSGLRVHYKHKQGYIYGRDWIDHILRSDNEPSQVVQG